jgi:hypothetical protein
MYLKAFKALLLGLCIAAVAMISWAPNSLAGGGYLEKQVQVLIQQNRALTDRLMQVEQQLSEMKAAPEPEPAYAGAAGFLSDLENRITFSGLLEFGAAYHSTDMNEGSFEHDSDLCMTTVELAIAAEVNDWVSAEMVLLYEDPTFEEETGSLDVDEAVITIANEDVTPAFLKAGKMFVPFGALFEHFPDDPLIDAPLTLLLGEISEKALLIGAEYEGFTVSTYAFNGDVEEAGGGDNVIESYGFDANYAFEDEDMGLDLLVGGSYISNLFEGGAQDALEDLDIDDYVGGAAAYFHVGYLDFFFDAEYMAATDTVGLLTEAGLLEGKINNIEVWNFELGYNYNWWRNLEITLKYAGSNDCYALGFPRDRYGINFNQEIFDNTVLSIGYMYDEYDDDNTDEERNSRDLVFGQLAVEF